MSLLFGGMSRRLQKLTLVLDSSHLTLLTSLVIEVEGGGGAL